MNRLPLRAARQGRLWQAGGYPPRSREDTPLGAMPDAGPHASQSLLHRVVDPLRQQPLAVKVPEITVLFWVVKLVTTFMGEATSDFFGDVNIAMGALVEIVILATALWWQFHVRRYLAWAYWYLAAAIAIFGTGVSDTLHIVLGIPYAGTSAFWAVVLAGVFWQWHRSEGTLSIHSVTSRRREIYYWTTVFVTFALGTALGDFTAAALNLGFLLSAGLFGALIAVPAIAWRFGVNSVATFWAAYVVTRPLGASFADYTSKSHHLSGINVGDGPTSAISAVVLIVLVAYLAMTRMDVQNGQASIHAADPVGLVPAPRETVVQPAQSDVRAGAIHHPEPGQNWVHVSDPLPEPVVGAARLATARS